MGYGWGTASAYMSWGLRAQRQGQDEFTSGIVKVVTLVVNNNTTEEHYSDGSLAGRNRSIFMWILTRQMPVSWTGREVEKRKQVRKGANIYWASTKCPIRSDRTPFCGWGNWGTRRWDNLAEATHGVDSAPAFILHLPGGLLELSCASISKSFLVQPGYYPSEWLRLANINGIKSGLLSINDKNLYSTHLGKG